MREMLQKSQHVWSIRHRFFEIINWAHLDFITKLSFYLCLNQEFFINQYLIFLFSCSKWLLSSFARRINKVELIKWIIEKERLTSQKLKRTKYSIFSHSKALSMCAHFFLLWSPFVVFQSLLDAFVKVLVYPSN